LNQQRATGNDERIFDARSVASALFTKAMKKCAPEWVNERPIVIGRAPNIPGTLHRPGQAYPYDPGPLIPRFMYLVYMNHSNQVAERLDGVSQGTNPAAVSS